MIYLCIPSFPLGIEASNHSSKAMYCPQAMKNTTFGYLLYQCKNSQEVLVAWFDLKNILPEKTARGSKQMLHLV